MICSPPSDVVLSSHKRRTSREEAFLSTQRRNSLDSLEALTKDSLKDLSGWREIGQSKSIPASAHSAKVYNPWWVQGDLQQSTENVKLGTNAAQEEKGRLNGVHHKAQQEEDEVQDAAISVTEHILEVGNVGFVTEHISEVSSVGNVTVVALLKACSDKKDLHRGGRIHADIVRWGLLKKNVFISSSLVNLYAKCGALDTAQRVFYDLPVRSIVSWNALIGGYAQHEHGEKAWKCYYSMQAEGFSPNTITFLCILKACNRIGNSDKGQLVHAHIVKAGLLEDARVSTALVDMYAKCGSLLKAQVVFDGLTTRDVVLWTALILGYAQHEYGEEALKCFEQMQLEGLCPDALTSACILKACGNVGVAYEGQKIHAELVSDGWLEKDMVAGSALVDMYANCGMLAEAQEVFDKLHVKNVVSWSALMEGYAQLGKCEIVFQLFDQMIREGTEPSWVTFTIVLNACCHRGLLEEGKTYFETTSNSYCIDQAIEHHTCMVDLFCRTGHLEHAIAVIEEMPIPANPTLLHTLLDACRKWGNMKLGRWAFECVVQLDEKDAAAYVCLSNFPASRQNVWTRTRWKHGGG